MPVVSPKGNRHEGRKALDGAVTPRSSVTPRSYGVDVGESDKEARPDRAVGALMGLACGDAVGTTLEFRRPGTFDPIIDMVGGGPFKLAAGEWTDDTSMALCLAESILDRSGIDLT